MITFEVLTGQTVRVDLSNESKPQRDLVWLKLVAEYGNRRVTVTDAGEAYEVELLPDPLMTELRGFVGSVLPMEQHTGA